MSQIKFNDLGAYNCAVQWLNYLNSLPISATLRLGKNVYVPTDADLLAAYTEADFHGYTPVLLSGGGVANLGGGLGARIDWNPVTWTPADGAVPNDIRTWYVTDAQPAPTVVFWAGPMDTLPTPLHSPSDSITIPPRFFVRSIY